MSTHSYTAESLEIWDFISCTERVRVNILHSQFHHKETTNEERKQKGAADFIPMFPVKQHNDQWNSSPLQYHAITQLLSFFSPLTLSFNRVISNPLLVEMHTFSPTPAVSSRLVLSDSKPVSYPWFIEMNKKEHAHVHKRKSIVFEHVNHRLSICVQSICILKFLKGRVA